MKKKNQNIKTKSALMPKIYSNIKFDDFKNND